MTAHPQLTVLFDYQRIHWNSIDSIGNPGPSAAELVGVISANRRLGAVNSIGFGWKDQSVFKLGFRYQPTETFTLRAGWNHGDSQIPNNETLINIIAPATVNDNLTLGGSYNFQFGEISLSYMHGLRKTNRDAQTNLFGAAARASITQHSLDVSWAKDF